MSRIEELEYRPGDPDSQVKVEREGSFENEYVYDLETAGGDHTFFGNGILLHNSLYIRMDAILKKLFGDRDPDWNDDADFNKIIEFVDGSFQNDINSHCADFICSKFHTTERRVEFKREKISEKAEFLAKKRYILKVRDSEGHRCDKFSYTGVDLKKNELPQALKDMMQDCVERMISENWTDARFQQAMKEMWVKYQSLSIPEISYVKNLNTPKAAVGFLEIAKGGGAQQKAAQFHNDIIAQLGLQGKYEQIRTSDRFHYLYILSNNIYRINVIGYKDRWPPEFDELFVPNRALMFEKCVLSPLKQIMINHSFGEFSIEAQQMETGQDGQTIFDL